MIMLSLIHMSETWLRYEISLTLNSVSQKALNALSVGAFLTSFVDLLIK